jgi:hypothetical protein
MNSKLIRKKWRTCKNKHWKVFTRSFLIQKLLRQKSRYRRRDSRRLSWSNFEMRRRCLCMNGCKGLLGDKLLNLRKRQRMLKATMTIIFGMISIWLIEMLTRMRNELSRYTSCSHKLILDLQRQTKWRAKVPHTFVYTLQEAVAAKVQIVSFTIECLHKTTCWPDKTIWEIYLEGLDTLATKITKKESGHLIKNVTLFVSQKYFWTPNHKRKLFKVPMAWLSRILQDLYMNISACLEKLLIFILIRVDSLPISSSAIEISQNLPEKLCIIKF